MAARAEKPTFQLKVRFSADTRTVRKIQINVDPEAEFINVQFCWSFWAESWEYLGLRLPYEMFTIQTSFKQLLLTEGGGVNPLVEVTENSKKENSGDFCPNYVQEFGLSWIWIPNTGHS